MKSSATTLIENPSPAASARRAQNGAAPLVSDPAVIVFIVLFALLYVPVLFETAKVWASDDNYSHGFLVLPVSMYILWMQRERIKSAEKQPSLWGVIPLLIGLSLQVTSYILSIKHIGMWSIVPTIAGAILLLHGPALWKICRFPVVFLLFAAPFSGMMLASLTASLQVTSSAGSTGLMSALGFTVLRHGNVIELPGAVLEIANACSGFHSIVSMLAFTFIYAYLFTENNLKRLLLIAITVPIALAANIARISILILAATYGGMNGYHMFHDPAAIGEILVDFTILVFIGRLMGCNNLRFAPQSAA
jgi:exosortase